MPCYVRHGSAVLCTCMHVYMFTFVRLSVTHVCTCLHSQTAPTCSTSQQARKLAQDGRTISSGYSWELGKLGLVEVGDQEVRLKKIK